MGVFLSDLELLLAFIPRGVIGNTAESEWKSLFAVSVCGLVALVLSNALLNGPVGVIHYAGAGAQMALLCNNRWLQYVLYPRKALASTCPRT